MGNYRSVIKGLIDALEYVLMNTEHELPKGAWINRQLRRGREALRCEPEEK